MKLVNDKILLESKEDIVVMQNMIDNYLFTQEEKEFLDDTPVKELNKLSDKLCLLGYKW